jgi:LmbE family N-acetylglucosaminyl deacetylase
MTDATRHILAIHAHPDDVEMLGSGTLALLAERGHHITIATMTAGGLGSTEHSLEETAQIRLREASTAAALIGASYRCAGLPDLGVFNEDSARRRTVELTRSVAPDIIITAAPVDYHPDHEATSLLVRDACFAVTIPNYRTGEARILGEIPHLYFMDPIGGRDRDGNKVRPDFAVDVARFMETKRRMLSAHESQRSWVLKQHGIDNYVGSMEAWTAKRGQSAGVEFAEGFRQYTWHPYPRTPLLQELVGDALIEPAS